MTDHSIHLTPLNASLLKRFYEPAMLSIISNTVIVRMTTSRHPSRKSRQVEVRSRAIGIFHSLGALLRRLRQLSIQAVHGRWQHSDRLSPCRTRLSSLVAARTQGAQADAPGLAAARQ